MRSTTAHLSEVRAALAKALEEEGLNVSGGDTITPPGAAVGAFTVEYHASFGGQPASRRRVLVNITVVTSRAHEASAYAEMDEALSYFPGVLERAPGPWLSLLVRGGGPSEPLTIGEATYTGAELATEIYL